MKVPSPLHGLGRALCGVGVALAAPLLGALHACRIYDPPAARRKKSPADRDLPLRSLRMTTSADRVPLDVWVVPGRGPNTVIVCHGMGRTKAAVLDHIRVLHEAGHHVVAYDLRNHGASGRRRRFGNLAGRFTSDLADVLELVRDDPELGGGQIAVLAFSFSTWPALQVLTEPTARVAAVVCDSGPTRDIAASFRYFCDLRRERMPRALRANPFFALYRWAFERTALSLLDVGAWPPDLSGVETRLLFVTGARDDVIPPQNVVAVARHYEAPHWTAPRAPHVGALRADRDEYVERLTGFLAAAFAHAEPRAAVASRG